MEEIKKAPVTDRKQGLKEDKCSNKNGEIQIFDIDIEREQLQSNNTVNFPVSIFHPSIRQFIAENIKTNCNIDYLSASILSACSVAIGRKYKVKVKKNWIVKANLYMVLVGRPGDGKSHPINIAFSPVKEIENKAYEEYQSLLNEYDNDQSLPLEQRSKVKKPVLKKILLRDFTPEALIKDHDFNKDSVCVFVDELNGWLKNFQRYNSSGEAETYLTLWSGETISIDRKTSKSIRINDPYVSVIGTIQSAILKEFSKEGRNSNGFMDRFLFVFPKNIKPQIWTNNDVHEKTLENYNIVIQNLLNLEYKIIDNVNTPNELPFSKEASNELLNWQNNNAIKIGNYFSDYERGIATKMEQYVIRFSLIIELLEYACSPHKTTITFIDKKSVASAIKLHNYFLSNAFEIRERIERGSPLDNLTEKQRVIYNKLPPNFTTQEALTISAIEQMKERTLKNFINTKRLFKRIERGTYKKT